MRGYHVYKDVWTAAIGEVFPCNRENGNLPDPFAVAVMRPATTVHHSAIIGHIPRKISVTCSLFLRRGGSITCQITGSMRFSTDLVQGGLEVPCTLHFVGEESVVSKAKKLLESALPVARCTTQIDSPASKRRKIDNFTSSTDNHKAIPNEWVRLDNCLTLTHVDKEIILAGEKLNDKHICLAQNMLKKQFSDIGGLQSTLLQSKPLKQQNKTIQVIHSRGDHWIVAAKILATEDTVLLYDSVYRTIDRATKDIINNLFSASISAELVAINRQVGAMDCGVFSIAISTALAFEQDPAVIKFDQSAMRPHLVECFETGQLSPFPCILN